jgi:hypothetical protein
MRLTASYLVCVGSKLQKNNLKKVHQAGGGSRVAKIFLDTTHQYWKNMPNEQNVTNDFKIFQTAVNYLYQHFPFQGHLKYTLVGIFVLQINHLATLSSSSSQV